MAEKNRELIREEHLAEIERHLQAAAELAPACGLGVSDLLEIMQTICGEEIK